MCIRHVVPYSQMLVVIQTMTISKKIFSRLFWTTIVLLSAYYFYRALVYRYYEEGFGPTFWNKQFWFASHILTAITVLILGPIQFWNWFRIQYTRWHRLLGKIYVIGSLAGGLTACYLGLTISFQGSIVPLVFLSVLWLFTTTAAWIAIRNGNIKDHRLFMIRSYTLALSFVFLRILADLVYKHNLLFFIDSPELKDNTYEWLSWVLPLLVVELCISWIPALRQKSNIYRLGKRHIDD